MMTADNAPMRVNGNGFRAEPKLPAIFHHSKTLVAVIGRSCHLNVFTLRINQRKGNRFHQGAGLGVLVRR